MAELQKLNGTLQESVLTLLAHDDVHGRAVSQMITPAAFTGDYRVVAEACLRYWQSQGRAPAAHLDDELGHALDPTSRKAQTFRRIVQAMHRLAGEMNTGYVLGKVQAFVRMQELKDAMVQAADTLNTPGAELKLEQVEAAFNDILRKRKVSFDPGLRLADYEAMLAYMERQDEFQFGIKQLDERFIVPTRGAVTLFLGAAKRGKSWFLVNSGRRNINLRKRVLHITLEMDAPEVQMRYYQSMFRLTKRAMEHRGKPVPERVRTFELTDDEDDRSKLVGFGYTDEHPAFTLDSEMVREELSTRIAHYSGRFDHLLIKRWAPRVLDESILRAYLEQLEVLEKFIPDVCLLDYMGLWKTNAANHRITLGRAFEDFRGICIERNMAGITAHQLSKAGDRATHATGGNVAEDWSMIGTADQVLVLSSTDWEFGYGLARLYVDRARNERDKFGLLMTQNYALGQFCMESIYLPSDYWAIVDDAGGGAASHGNGNGGLLAGDDGD